MQDQLGKMLKQQGKTSLHPLMAALLDKLFYSCFLFDFHHLTDHPVTDGTTSSFGLVFSPQL